MSPTYPVHTITPSHSSAEGDQSSGQFNSGIPLLPSDPHTSRRARRRKNPAACSYYVSDRFSGPNRLRRADPGAAPLRLRSHFLDIAVKVAIAGIKSIWENVAKISLCGAQVSSFINPGKCESDSCLQILSEGLLLLYESISLK